MLSAEAYMMTADDSPADVAQFVAELIVRLSTAYPDAGCELHYETPFQLLVATILSVQTTEERVNEVTAVLFSQHPTPEAILTLSRFALEQRIKPTGFYRQKAKFIHETCQMLLARFNGEPPGNMGDLTQLPGVARKTASVFLAECYDTAEGIVVDTHVLRLANRLGLSKGSNAVKVEHDLMRVVPHKQWITIAHLLISHGRRVCHVRNPRCQECLLCDLCPSNQGHREGQHPQPLNNGHYADQNGVYAKPGQVAG